MEVDNILSQLPALEGKAGEYFVRRPLVRQPDYEEAYWGKIVDPDGNVRDRLAERERFLTNLKHEVEFLRGLQPGRILDIGCGLGFLLSALDERWDRHGVELSAYAANHASQWGQIFVGDVTAARYPDAWFDLVVMHHVIEHIEDPGGTITEVRRILRRGGVLVLGTPDFDSGCARLFGDRYRLLHDPTHVSLFSSDSMHRFLRDYGFTIDRVDYPYFDTPYFSPENLERLFNQSEISPPFYGNFMTFYCHKPESCAVQYVLREISRAAAILAGRVDGRFERAVDSLLAGLRSDSLYVWGDAASQWMIQGLAEEVPAVRQVSRAGEVGNGVVLVISADSASAATREFLAEARERGCETVALANGPASADVSIVIDHANPRRVRELQAVILGCLAELLASEATPQTAGAA